MALVLYVYLPGSWNGEESCLTVTLAPRLMTELSNAMHIVLYQLVCGVISTVFRLTEFECDIHIRSRSWTLLEMAMQPNNSRPRMREKRDQRGMVIIIKHNIGNNLFPCF